MLQLEAGILSTVRSQTLLSFNISYASGYAIDYAFLKLHVTDSGLTVTVIKCRKITDFVQPTITAAIITAGSNWAESSLSSVSSITASSEVNRNVLSVN